MIRIVEQILASEERNKSKRAGLWESQSQQYLHLDHCWYTWDFCYNLIPEDWVLFGACVFCLVLFMILWRFTLKIRVKRNL